MTSENSGQLVEQRTGNSSQMKGKKRVGSSKVAMMKEEKSGGGNDGGDRVDDNKG